MSQQTLEMKDQTTSCAGQTVLELTVRNHPGVMAHISGLFSRRAYNVEGILCMPIGDGNQSRIWLRVAKESPLQQVIKQLEKLEDVIWVEQHDADHAVFVSLEKFFQG